MPPGCLSVSAVFCRSTGEHFMSAEITVRELARLIENGHAVRLIDVRQPWENELAKLPDSLLMPLNELPARAAEIALDPTSTVVCYCHHGVRSLSAAAYLRRLGHVDVRSLAGGIDAWSCEVDPGVARY
jgi:adenylyltransferase/sulfurtransferase